MNAIQFDADGTLTGAARWGSIWAVE